MVGGRVKGEGRLAGEDADLALLRGELPGEYVGDGGVEGDADALGRGDGDDAGGNVQLAAAGAAVGADGGAAPAGLLADLHRNRVNHIHL